MLHATYRRTPGRRVLLQRFWAQELVPHYLEIETQTRRARRWQYGGSEAGSSREGGCDLRSRCEGATSQKQVQTSRDGWLPPYGGNGSGCDNEKGDGDSNGGIDGDESDGAECDGERCGDGSTRGTCDPTSASKARRDPKSTGGEGGAYDENGETKAETTAEVMARRWRSFRSSREPLRA